MSRICSACATPGEGRAIHVKNAGDGGLIMASVVCGFIGLIIWPLLLLAGFLFLLAIARMIVNQAKALGVERYECERCKGNMIPLDTPAGRDLAAKSAPVPGALMRADNGVMYRLAPDGRWYAAPDAEPRARA